MAKKRVDTASRKRTNRMMLTFNDHDFAMLKQEAKEAKLPPATQARLLVLRQLALNAPHRKASKA